MKKHFAIFSAFTILFLITGCSTAIFLSTSQRLELEGDELAASDRISEAVLAYYQAVSADPHNGSARVKLASQYFGQGRTREAVEIFSALPDDEKTLSKLENQEVSPENLENIVLKWIQSPGLETPSGIAADSDMVAVAYDTGLVSGLKLHGGNIQWTRKLDEVITSPPSIALNTVVVGCESGRVIALDRKNGNTLWEVHLMGTVYAEMLVDGSTGYIGSYQGMMTAIDLADGKILWQLDAGNPILVSAIKKDGILYFGTTVGSVFSVDASDGTPLWEEPVQLSGGIESKPVLTESRLLIGTNDSRLYALDLNGKDYYWSHSTPDSIYASPLVEANSVYLFSIGQVSAGVNLASGNPIWEQELPVAVKNTPVISNGVIYFAGTTQPFLYEMDVNNGKITGQANTGDWIEYGPIEANGYLLLAGKDGSILAYEFIQD